MKKTMLVIVVLSLGFFGFWWMNKEGQLSNQKKEMVSDPTVQKIISKGTLIVGTEATYPPMESVDEKGKIMGFDVDLVGEVASAIGVKLEVRNIPWDDLFVKLDSGEIDMAMSSITITPERNKTMLFSRPYFSSGQSIVTKKDDKMILTAADLKGKKVGVYEGTTSEVEALKYTDSKMVVRVKGDSNAKLVKDLVDGKIDAFIIDYPVAVNLAQKNSGLKVGKPFTNEFYGIAMKKGQTGLTKLVDDVIRDLTQSGKMQSLQKRWGL